MRPRRLIALGMLIALIGIGLWIVRAAPDTAATDIAGDALYAGAAYLGVVLLMPRLQPVIVGLIAGAWCVAVELFQLTGVPEQLGVHFPPAMLLLGTVFDARDLWVYLVVAAVVTAGDRALLLHTSRRAQRREEPAPQGHDGVVPRA